MSLLGQPHRGRRVVPVVLPWLLLAGVWGIAIWVWAEGCGLQTEAAAARVGLATAEQKRQDGETAAEAAEKSRQNAVTTAEAAEEARQTAEKKAADAEKTRQTAERKAADTEETRQSAEKKATDAEKARNAAVSLAETRELERDRSLKELEDLLKVPVVSSPPPIINTPTILANKSVQKELKLNDDQAAKIDQAAAERKQMARVAAATLNPEQAKRFAQLQLQAAGPYAFSRLSVQHSLMLTDKQVANIGALLKELGPPKPGVPLVVAWAKRTEAEQETITKILVNLTDDQKKLWETMLGASFEPK